MGMLTTFNEVDMGTVQSLRKELQEQFEKRNGVKLGFMSFFVKAAADALHIAVAAVRGLDYLLTWNCTHIANARTRGKIEGLCRAAGYDPPMLCTPMELMEE